jgi:hypothetical protein
MSWIVTDDGNWNDSSLSGELIVMGEAVMSKVGNDWLRGMRLSRKLWLMEIEHLE